VSAPGFFNFFDFF